MFRCHGIWIVTLVLSEHFSKKKKKKIKLGGKKIITRSDFQEMELPCQRSCAFHIFETYGQVIFRKL